ncbi:hypothetical protein [Paenibacillus thermotolerans]|uniref:hypothetical protein n=1 Tax=Paenibacillus thermotolerans TaxID=3027807 RepID=UPI0023685A7B|nr:MULTISPECIES: hypothetical protein [unclassified Paenibacillus]
MTHSRAFSGTGDAHTRATFQALADAIIPPMLETNYVGGAEIIPGAPQFDTDRYLIKQLDHSQFVPVGAEGTVPPLSVATARLLDIGAERLVLQDGTQRQIYPSVFPGGGLFSTLSRIDRLFALHLLDRLDFPLSEAPPPFTDHPALIRIIVNSLYQLTLFGYYSEWFGYGTTRLNAPQDRRIQYFPPGWRFVEYPGPSFGYRGYRGFVLKYPRRKGEDSNG